MRFLRRKPPESARADNARRRMRAARELLKRNPNDPSLKADYEQAHAAWMEAERRAYLAFHSRNAGRIEGGNR